METRSKSLNAKEIPVEKDGPAAKDDGSLPESLVLFSSLLNEVFRFQEYDSIDTQIKTITKRCNAVQNVRE